MVTSLIELTSSIKIASCSWDNTIIIWLKNTKTNQYELEQTLKEHSHFVRGLVNISND